ncbi:uncharacterized protein LOC113506466 [Trichoplusia ni]|uniref:Uncharacterized protein LOC113506466 n=1 Tax=Trichoplusia ni TaxID=7111 RepID=A0A7E5WX80_TRINI|nr:uncharacterized protein LOC113506466 [Trichoplusia ni]
MGYLLERCPVVHHCCGLPLRAAALGVALLGLCLAAAYLALFSQAGAGWVRELAGGGSVAAALRYVHGVLGVLLAALHALLLLGAAAESDALCDVYAWGMLACGAGAVAGAATLAGAAAAAARRGTQAASPALREALHTLRDAWPEPRSLLSRW